MTRLLKIIVIDLEQRVQIQRIYSTAASHSPVTLTQSLKSEVQIIKRRNLIMSGNSMFTLKKWNLVAMWSWDVECDTCAICRVQVMGKSVKLKWNFPLTNALALFSKSNYQLWLHPVVNFVYNIFFLLIDNFTVISAILHRGTIRAGLTIKLQRLQPWALKKSRPSRQHMFENG